MLNIPTLRQLTYFVALAETLSFREAAARCNVTQPTFSEGIKTLEDILGEPLFTRSKRHVILTPVGQDLLLPARDIIARTEDLVEKAHARREPFSGPLMLGVIPTIAPYLLPALLPVFQTHMPRLNLQLKEDVTGQLLTALDQRQIDLVLMAFPYDTPGMTQMVLWQEPFVIARPGTTPFITQRATLEDLANYNIMLLEDGHCLRDHALAACHLQPQRQKTFGATSLTTLIQMVQHGYGATLLPAMAVTPQPLPAGVSIQRFTNPQPHRTIGLCWRQGHPRAAEFRELGEMIAKSRNHG